MLCGESINSQLNWLHSKHDTEQSDNYKCSKFLKLLTTGSPACSIPRPFYTQYCICCDK